MGRVFLAYESALDRPVALKFIAHRDPGPDARGRFVTEARAIARLQHPNVVAIYRIGEIQGRPYIAYEYLDGASLDQAARPISWERALAIGVAVTRGLSFAHRRGVLHRDIKPGNIVETREGVTKLVDFGVAKLLEAEAGTPDVHPSADAVASTVEGEAGELWRSTPDESGTQPPVSLGTLPSLGSDTTPGAPTTRTGTIVGTPSYVAPEIWQGRRATTRSEVYSTGLVLYELIAGRLPHEHLRGIDLARHVVNERVPPLFETCPSTPQSLASVIDRCIERDPTLRYADAAELCETLEQVDSVLCGYTRSGNAGIERDQAHRVASSLARVMPRADELFTRVYDRLFQADPSLRLLFPADMHEQRKKLGAALRLAVDQLRNPGYLLPLLEDLGRRHVGYGVRAEHFATLGEALIVSIAEFDGAWDDATSKAWSNAYGAIAEAMKRGFEAG